MNTFSNNPSAVLLTARYTVDERVRRAAHDAQARQARARERSRRSTGNQRYHHVRWARGFDSLSLSH